MKPIVKSIKKLLKQTLNISPVSLIDSTDLRKDLNLVDWEIAYLLNAVEKAWHISISENVTDKTMNVKYLKELVRMQVPKTTLAPGTAILKIKK
jgi:hypothetical protein